MSVDSSLSASSESVNIDNDVVGAVGGVKLPRPYGDRRGGTF